MADLEDWLTDPPHSRDGGSQICDYATGSRY